MLTSQQEHAVIVLYQDRVASVAHALAADQDLWLTPLDLTASTGWSLEPDGVCRDEVCVPIPPGRADAFIQERNARQWFNLTEFARLLEQPCAHDPVHNVWSFGPSVDQWKASLISTPAPDFTLPDLDGNTYSLSSFIGKKVVLALWASW